MNGPYFTFMLVPCAAAISIGYLARHWTLAAAALTGGLGLLFLITTITAPLSVFIAPAASGAAVAGLILTPMLLRRPSVSVWSRMSAALGAVFLTHLAFLTFALAGR